MNWLCYWIVMLLPIHKFKPSSRAMQFLLPETTATSAPIASTIKKYKDKEAALFAMIRDPASQ